MKNLFKVIFKADGIYCTNIAKAYDEAFCRFYYDTFDYDEVIIREAEEYELEEAERKGMPIVEIERTEEAIMDDILELMEDEDKKADALEELDSYIGILGDDRLNSMYDLDDLFYSIKPSDLLQKIDFNNFSDTDDYFYFNGYGNMVSTDYREYPDYDIEDYIGDFLDNMGSLYLDNDFQELLEELEASRTFWDEV